MPTPDSITGLPGEALMRQGLADLLSGHMTAPACLIQIARSRRTRAGFIPAGPMNSLPDPEALNPVLPQFTRQNQILVPGETTNRNPGSRAIAGRRSSMLIPVTPMRSGSTSGRVTR
jgi:hypothetical protein